jgi:hypothetical protein
VAYRANSPLSRADVRDKIIQVALEYSDRGDSSASLVREINAWTGITGVTREALRAAWARWCDVVPDLPAFGQLFSTGAKPGTAYRKVDADIERPIRNPRIGSTLDSLLDEDRDDLRVAERRMADLAAGRSRTIPAAEVYEDIDLSEWDRDDRTEPGAPDLSGLEGRPVAADGLERWLLIPDCHVPYHDVAAFSLMLRAAQACGITNCAVLGDFADFHSVSAHDKDPRRRHDLQWEIDEVNRALDTLDTVFPGRRLFLEGNHEDRLRRYLSTMAAAMFHVTSTVQAFRLAERGWSFVAYKTHAKIGRLHLTHDLGKAGKYAHYDAVNAFQGNVVIGHTHRLGYAVEGSVKGKAHVGAMLGWLGDVERADYMFQARARRDWAHGFGILYVEPSGDVHITPVPIVNGRVVVEGRLVT